MVIRVVIHAENAGYCNSINIVRSQSMPTIKQAAHELIDHLPDQATWDDVMYTLYVRQKLERSLQAAKEGKVTSQEDAKKRFLNDAR